MEKISLRKQKPFFLWHDVLSILLIYGVLAPILYRANFVEFLYLKFFLILLFFFNCIYFLICETKDYYRDRSRFVHVGKIDEATHVFFEKVNKHEKREYSLIKIETDKIKLDNDLRTTVRFFFRQKIKYYWRKEEKKFMKIKPFISQPVSSLINNPASVWVDNVEKNLMEKNNLVFPLPNFKQIFKKEITDPLKFFQIFSSALWFFDDNFYYPLMTVCLLVVTNMMTCMQTITSILGLRSLQTKPYWVMVKNSEGGYDKKSSEDLLPGDIIQLKTSKELKGVDTKKQTYFELMKEVQNIVPFGDKLPPHLLQRFVPQQEE